jgi:hypothetical protein
VDYLTAANAAREAAVVQGSTAKQALAWRHWEAFLREIGVPSAELFLDSFTKGEKHQLLDAFATAIRQGDFSATRYTCLKADSCVSFIGYMAQTFLAAGKPDPRFNLDGRLAYILQQQYRGYITWILQSRNKKPSW